MSDFVAFLRGTVEAEPPPAPLAPEAPASPDADTQRTPDARAAEASSAPAVAPPPPGCGWPIPGDDGRAATPKQAAALRYLAGPGAGRSAVDVVSTIRRHVGKQRPEELTRAEAGWLLDTVRLGERAPAEERQGGRRDTGEPFDERGPPPRGT